MGLKLVALVMCASCTDGPAKLTDGTAAELADVEVTGLQVVDRRIVDASGRAVIVRALQHHALQDVDYGGRAVAPEDYARIAGWGFTAIRVAISWSRIEPTPGGYDAAYLAEVREVLDRAHTAGIGVILEWHQDLWGRCTQPVGGGNRASANGAPDWTCPSDLGSGLFVHWLMFDRLWANTDGLEDSFLGAWQATLTAIGAHPALIGIEPMNEPQGTGGTPSLERDQIYPAYRRWSPRLRAAGARGLIFVDAPILRNEVTDLHVEDLTDVDRQAVFAPHLYTGWLRLYLLDGRVAPTFKTEDFAMAVDQAAGLGLPLWNGEWGVNLTVPGAIEDLTTHVELEDAHRIGSSYWAFQRVATGPGWGTGPQALLDHNSEPRADVLQRLSRPYPIATPGELLELSTTDGLLIRYRADPAVTAPLIVFLPRSHLGQPCLDVSVDREPVSWRYAALAGDRFAIEIAGTGEVRVIATRCD